MSGNRKKTAAAAAALAAASAAAAAAPLRILRGTTRSSALINGITNS